MKTIDDVMNFKIYLQSSSKAMADRQNKSEEQKYKTWISSEREELSGWNKKHFS